MKPIIPLVLLLPLSACGGNDVDARDVVVPELNQMSETPGDWSDLAGMVGRTPADSGLFQRSAITIDLDALLGEDARAFRLAMGNASALRRYGPVLVSVSPTREAFLLILPQDHALEAGYRKAGRWRTVRTPGAEVPRPAAIQALLQS